MGLAFDAAGNLYVANRTSNNISKFTFSGSPSVHSSILLKGPQNLAFDAAGYLYVSNFIGNTVSKVELAPPVAAPVPTLSEWAMILMGVLLAGGAAFVLQRRPQPA